MSKTFEIKGLKELIGKIDKLPKKIAEDIGDVLEAGALDMVAEAKRRAPTDLGGLKNGISAFRVGDLQFQVVSNMYYSAFVEFGTGGLVNVPAGLEDYAQQFRGKGVKQVNILPQPFFFPALERLKPILIKEIKDVLAKQK